MWEFPIFVLFSYPFLDCFKFEPKGIKLYGSATLGIAAATIVICILIPENWVALVNYYGAYSLYAGLGWVVARSFYAAQARARKAGLPERSVANRYWFIVGACSLSSTAAYLGLKPYLVGVPNLGYTLTVFAVMVPSGWAIFTLNQCKQLPRILSCLGLISLVQVVLVLLVTL